MDLQQASRPKKGMRGAAPWTQRHLSKQMEDEKKHRDSSPPPPGSARASLRTPKDIEGITIRVEMFHEAIARILEYRKTASVNFWEIGTILAEIEDFRLYVAKGYTSIAHMLERETLPWDKATSMAFLTLARILRGDAAREMGVVRAFEMLKILETR